MTGSGYDLLCECTLVLVVSGAGTWRVFVSREKPQEKTVSPRKRDTAACRAVCGYLRYAGIIQLSGSDNLQNLVSWSLVRTIINEELHTRMC